MNIMIRTKAIESRAARLGLSLRALCEAADAPYSTVRRWRTKADANPGAVLFHAVMTKLEGWLEQRERDLLAELVELYPRTARRLVDGEPERREDVAAASEAAE